MGHVLWLYVRFHKFMGPICVLNRCSKHGTSWGRVRTNHRSKENDNNPDGIGKWPKKDSWPSYNRDVSTCVGVEVELAITWRLDCCKVNSIQIPEETFPNLSYFPLRFSYCPRPSLIGWFSVWVRSEYKGQCIFVSDSYTTEPISQNVPLYCIRSSSTYAHAPTVHWSAAGHWKLL